ncbi:GRAM domain-containing protein 2B-like isoform X2 [Syngnathus typhle]|uniref:GRAM domain-containing protein 2B-like isoform X2 n=1 Tax=Syngnathus typhle TaxID=161592 RepID=UPI002A6B59D0|nr:GRAM domain-containing protein 2B-like isoform X2 [Syngnathus typhle]
MGEQAERPLTPPCRTTDYPSGSSFEVDNDVPSARRRPTHLRLSKSEVKKSPSTQVFQLSRFFQLSKTNLQFHKLFKEVSRDEALTQSYTCALQRDILYQGKMFVSPNWICFHSKVFGRDTKIAIRAASVTFIKKTKTALLVPNALVIESTREQHVFVSFLSRNTTYKFLRSVCVHLEVEKTCGSHVASSCENGFGVKRPPSLPLDLARTFSDLDGVVRQRRQEMEAESSSSSGSQTPDCDKMAEFASVPNTFLSREVSVHADVHLQPGQKSRAKSGPSKSVAGATQADKAWPHTTLLPVLLIYLFLVGVLVVSSCYMALKMAALEHRLNVILSARDRVHAGYEDPKRIFGKISTIGMEDSFTLRNTVTVQDAEIFGELSASLLKLEKIQRNLRKLLEDT